MTKELPLAVLPEKIGDEKNTEEIISAAYAGFIAGEQKTATEVSRIYSEIFYDKKADENLIAQASLEKAADFLADTKREIEAAGSQEEKEEIVQEFEEELKARAEIKKKALDELKTIATEFNELYKEIWNINILKEMDKLRGTNDMKFESTESLNAAVTKGYKPWWLIYEEQKGKYDGRRIEELLAGYKDLVFQDESNKEYADIIGKLEELLKYQSRLENKINQIAEGNFHQKIENGLLERYEEIKEVVKNLDGFIQKDFGGLEKHVDTEKIASQLLQEARNIAFTSTGSEEEQRRALEKLEKIKSSLLLFKTIFKTVIKEHPELGFGYFKNLDFKISEGKEISETDRAAMISIIEKNYSDLEERKIALAGLEKGLKNKRTVFEILRHKSEIVSFLRFDRIWDQEPPAPDSYFGSFNTNPDFQEASIGDAMIRECLNEEAYLHILEAHTFPDKKITSKYVEEAGFIIEDIELNYMDTGKALFRIRRDDKMNRRYRFRGETKPEDKKFFETVAESGDVSESGNPFLKIEANKISDIITLEKIKTFMQKHNLVITRYFPDDKKNPKYYILAFEVKIPEPEPVAYIV